MNPGTRIAALPGRDPEFRRSQSSRLLPRAAAVVLGTLSALAPSSASAQNTPPEPAEPGRIPPSIRPGVELRRQRMDAIDAQQWPTELALSELTPLFRRFFTQIEAGNVEPGSPDLPCLPDFRATLPTFTEPESEEPNGLSYREASCDSAEEGLESFLRYWKSYLADFGPVDRTEWHAGPVDLTQDGAHVAAATVEVDFRLTSPESSSRRDDQFTAEFLFRQAQPGSGWAWAGCRIRSLASVRGPRQFTPVTEGIPPDAINPAENLFVAYFAEGVALGDWDGDGDLDLFYPRRNSTAVLLANDGQGRFEDATDRCGLGAHPGVRCGYFFDLENDGDLDLLLIARQRMHLLENRGAVFTDISERSGFHRMFTDGLTGAAFADWDRDGFLDFYVVNYGDPATGPGFGYFDSRNGFFNKLFRNRGDGSFEDRTAETGLDLDNRRWSFAALWFDPNEDGHPDLYVVNDYGPNQYFENRGDGSFVDVAAERGAADPGNGMAASWGDLDGDGRLDLYVSNMESYAGKRITHAAGFPGEASSRDRARRFAKGNTFLRHLGAGRFEEIVGSPLEHARWAWGNVLADLDNDGDLDVYVANGMFSNSREHDT